MHQDKPEGFLIGQKMEILHRYTNACLWSGDAETIKEAVEKAVEDGANLNRANLTGAILDGANLTGANLDGANLNRANLYGANLDGANLNRANLNGANLNGVKISRILSIGPLGSRNAYLVAWLMEDGTRRYSTGCQVQIEEDAFLARVQETHGDNAHAKAYRAAVEFARALADGAGIA